jgi:DNA helicase-2/ATP-dependent DNA helicase PcrA
MENHRSLVAPPKPMAPPQPATSLNTFRPAAAQKPKGSGIRAGSTVRHPRYGKGSVLRREGDGDDAKLVIHFAAHGLKKLVEKYAGVELLD